MTKEELFGLAINKPDETIRREAKKHLDSIAKPIDGLGDLEEMICRIAAIQGRLKPDLTKKGLVIMCADNGVVEEGVTQCGQEVTFDVASLMGKNQSSVGIMTRDYPVEIIPVDIGIRSDRTIEGVLDKKVAKGTRNMAKEAAMTEEECLKAIETGIQTAGLFAEKGFKIAATGEMGIGNTTTATALICALTGASPDEITGRGAGLSDEGLSRKKEVIKRALKLHGFAEGAERLQEKVIAESTDKRNDEEPVESADKRKGKEPAKSGCSREITELSKSSVEDAPESEKEYVLHALSSVGGLDIAGLTGFFIGGALYHLPVVTDGLISVAAACTASLLVPGCEDYMIASHLGKESGCAAICERLGLKPVLNANLALGEGTGAVLVYPVLDMALSLYLSGTGFNQTQIGQYERFES